VQASNLTEVVAVTGGNAHSLAIKSDGTGDGSANDGTVYTWGSNSKGQLGHDPNPATSGFEPSSTPSQVSGLTDVKDVASGLNHNLATTSPHGAVWAWGCNDYGQLGNSGVQTNPGSNCVSPYYSNTPVQTIGLFNAAEVAGGGSHSMALANVDNTDPTTIASATTADGPYTPDTLTNKDVTVDLSAADDAGGSGVKEIVYSASGAQTISPTTVAGNSTSITINTEGETAITYSAADNAGNTETEQTFTVKLDKSAPMVDSWAPTGTGVSRSTNISATFSDEMDQATLTTSTIKLINTSSGKRVKNVTVNYDEASQTVTLDPFGTSTTVLTKNTKYKVIISTGVENLAGIPMAQKKVWSFKTRSSA
jgi:hypothetical protein